MRPALGAAPVPAERLRLLAALLRRRRRPRASFALACSTLLLASGATSRAVFSSDAALASTAGAGQRRLAVCILCPTPLADTSGLTTKLYVR